MVVNPTVGVALLTIFDVFMIWLTYREYGKATDDTTRLPCERGRTLRR